MSNILDYINWRGDLPLSVSPLNDADRLILCRLSYIPFDGIVGDGFRSPVPLRTATAAALDAINTGKFTTVSDQDPVLLQKLTENERFTDVSLANYSNIFDVAQQEQFSAVTFLLPDKTAYVAFRGTDHTLIGWREDFNMSFSEKVPAQEDARKYLEATAAKLGGAFRRPTPIRVGGHSKGGNLAVYSAAFCDKKTRSRILEVRSLDGPGFMEKTIEKEGFSEILGITRTIVPQSSIIGMLLSHEEDFNVVKSDNTGIMQHDLYSWQLERCSLVPVESVTKSSRYIDSTLKDFIGGMTPELRQKFVDAIFTILTSSDAVNLNELASRRGIVAIFKTMRGLDDETRGALAEAFTILKGSLKRNLPLPNFKSQSDKQTLPTEN